MKNRTVIIFVAVMNAIGVIATITVNALAATLPINGKTTQFLSDSLPNLFVPAGLTFSIWGIIYLLLIAYGIYQLTASFQRDTPAFIGKIGWLFVLASAENCAWIFAWHYQQLFISMLIMIALLFTLLAIYLRLGVPRLPISKRERWFVQLPFSVYFGWITVATIANATALLVDLKWNAFGVSPVIWTLLVLAVGTAIAVSMVISRKDVAFSLVVLWAFLGIAIKRLNAPSDFSAAMSTPVGIAAVIGMGVITVAIFISGFRKHRTA